MRSFIAASAITFLAGCASQSTPPSAPVTAPVAAPVATTAVVSQKSSVPAGYKAVERNGTTLYCAKVASLGTKFKQEVCMTQDQYDEVQRRGENARQDLRKTTKMCAGGSGIGSCNGS